MSISFNAIPINLRVPGQYIEITNENAVRSLTGYPTKVLVIGQKLAAGTALANTPLLITSVDQAVQLFGRGSQLAHMLEKFKKANSFVEVWAIAQADNGAGAAAAGALTFTGPATAAGTLNIYIAGRLVQAAVAAADTAANIATAVAAAITANLDLPVTAAVDGVVTSKVNITARHKGECANTIDLRLNYYQGEALPAGVTVTVTAMAAGTGNPDVDDVITAIGDNWYTDIVMPYTDAANIVSMEAALDTRSGPLKMIEGTCYVARANTHANLVTAGQARNSQHMTAIGYNKSPTPAYEWAAVYGAICAYHLQIDPARPVQTLTLTGILPPEKKDCFTMEEQNILLYNGISTFDVDAGGLVRISRAITTYRVNPFNAPDPSYLNIETMKTLAYLRYDTRTFIALRYPRHKLADDGTNFSRGQNVVTPKVIRMALIARFRLWEEAGLVENIEQFKTDLQVERNGPDRDRLDAIIPPDVINQFRVLAAKVDYRL